MPRARDIGWEHGTMIAGHRHHVQCNYCNRIMIGGVTRFKKHLASRRGEIRGCEAVPNEVRELIEKHLVAWETRKTTDKKRKKVHEEASNDRAYDDKDTDSDDESDRDYAAARMDNMRALHEAEEAHQSIYTDHEEPTTESQVLYDSFPPVQFKSEQGSAPPRATDLGWVHGLMVDGDQQKIKCRYCHKMILGGGISRLKQHLAGERGNIAPCDKVPEEVKSQMLQHLGFKVWERKKKLQEVDFRDPHIPSQGKEECKNEDSLKSPLLSNSGRSGKEWDEGTSGRRKRQRKQVIPLGTPSTQPPLQHLPFSSQESVDQADMALWVLDIKMPSYDSLRGDLLDRSTQEADELCQDLRKSWEVTGCSVIADRWINRTGCTVIKFFIYCSKGTIFLKSIDASEASKSSEELFNLFDSIVQEVGPRNIVHFITDTTPNYKAAGKMLMNKYKTFFWSACATHCINLMLEELGEIDEIKEALRRAKKVCQLIYNHAWVLNKMRKITGGRDIVRPALTRFATNFLTLQNIVSLKEPLHQMFTSTTWMESAMSKQRSWKVTETVLDPQFWSLCSLTLKVTEPLLAILNLVGSEERPCMGYLYDAMEKASRAIIDSFDSEESSHLPFLKVIDRIWEEDLHSPLHAAAHFLNPSIFYNPGFCTNPVIQKGLLDCIEGLEPSLTAQDMITRQKISYDDAVGDFSRPVAIRDRGSLAPATWWSLYAADYPDLQRFAIRISSQTCSGTRCDRNWSTFERIHLKSRNRLEHERLDNLIFVHYNLRLQERHSAACKTVRQTQDPICVEELDNGVDDWVEDPGDYEEEMGWMGVSGGLPHGDGFSLNKPSGC
ncbi:hypothetical protein C5167_045589 [Papaver somniferum]|uniref:BED-type domain-containing protein n=1 Tax=Papaver somniferum TaxID=3469 RepID=A0A4Y7LET2_PAPSO|nr:hypothetical protein C5167_045589 [Papaver somniferum]